MPTSSILASFMSNGPLTTIDVPPLLMRADVAPRSINVEARTVDLVFSTGAAVERFDWMSGTRYVEKLSMDPAHVRLDRLNSGAPLLDTHEGYSVRSQLGAIVRGSAQVVGKQGRASVMFSRRADVADVFQDVQDGIISNVSVGYRVHAYEETPAKKGSLPVRTAVDWEPFEISMVPMPADAGAQTRSDKSTVQTNPCTLTTRAAEAAVPPQETTMDQDRQSEFVIEQNPLAPSPPARPADPGPVEPNDRDRGVGQERDRINGIMAACRAARLPLSFQDKLIAEGIQLVDAQARVFQEMSTRDVDVPRQSAVSVQLGDDHAYTHARKGIHNAILHRVNPTAFPLEDVGREYRGMTMLDVAKAFVGARNIRTTGMSKMEIAGVALGLETRGGMHTTSDFANLLADVANKNLRQAYDQSPQTFKPIARQISASDFKNINLVQFGEAPALSLVNEHGEFKRGSITDAKETFALKTYGKIFAITRQALINDDLDAFSRVPAEFGRAAMRLESDLVWEQITSNPTMGDGNALFIAAHSNLETDGDVISIASLTRARTSMRLQKGLDASTVLNLAPRFLIVPAALETVAQQFVGVITPASAAAVNPFTGTMSIIVEPRLDAASATAWYVGSDPNASGIDIIVYAYLEGQSGPTIETRVNFDVDGIEIKARHDFAAKIADWRGLHKDPGELVS